MSRCTLAALVLVAWTAPAPFATAQQPAHLALERGDFDGDGRGDSVRLGLDGGIRVELGGTTLEEPLGGGFVAKRGVIASARGPGLRGTVVVVEGFASRGKDPRGYAHVYYLPADRRGSPTRVWHGAIGPQGTDAEWAQRLALSDKALLLFETRPELTSCATRKPLRLELRAFDFAQGRFRPVRRKAAGPAAANTLLATTESPPSAPALGPSVLVRATGATSRRGDSTSELATPTAIDDGDPRTAWVEGKSGPGIGEMILFRQPAPAEPIAAVAFLPGHGASAADLRQRGRLRRFALRLFADGHRVDYVIEVPRDPTQPEALQWVTLPKTIAATCIEIEVLDTYAGSLARGGRDELAIAEMHLLTVVELGGDLDEVLAKRVASGGTGASTAIGALRRRGSKGTRAVLTALAGATAPVARQRLIDALVSLGDPSAAGAIAEAVAHGMVARDRDSALDALTAYGADGATALATLLTSKDTADALKVAVLERYQRMDEASSETYLALLGRGSRELRQRAATALARSMKADASALVDLASSRTDAGAEADLWRAIGDVARGLPADEQSRVATALSERLLRVDDYERRYRIVGALAPLPAGTESLSRWWDAAKDDRSPHTTALRRIAVSAAHDNHSALPLRLRALRDTDPGVRARAVASLTASDIPGAAAVLFEHLRTDPWPMVRANTAALLSQDCASQPARSALLSSARTDGDVEVQQAGILALLRCAPDTAPEILAIAGDPKQAFAVRSYAVLQVGSSGRQTHAPALVALLDQNRRRAFDSEAAQALAADTATALGRLADPRARDPLLRATEDEAYPSIQAAAAAALGSICDAHVARRLRTLAASPQRTVSLAARASLRRCARSR